MTKRTVKRPEDSGKELGELEGAGTRVWERNGEYYGLTLGWAPRFYTGEAGLSTRVAVLWPDGGVTWPCNKGILAREGRWQIG
jgi:hypothetical protein